MFFYRKVVFRQGRLEQVSRDFHTGTMVIRVKVDGEFFFTNLLQFENPDTLMEQVKNLKAGGEAVFLGAHQLDNGSFWLHWLKAPGLLELVPEPPEKTVESAREKMTVRGCLALLCLFIGLAAIFGGGSGGMLMLGLLLLVGGVIAGVTALDSMGVLANSATAVDKTIHRGLERLDAALAEGRPWDMPGLGASAASPPPEPPSELPPGLRACRVDRARVRQQSVRGLAGRRTVPVDYLVYDFDCDGTPVSWPIREEIPSTYRMLAFRRHHPPFLGAGDWVVVYCADAPGGLGAFLANNRLPDLEYQPALELFNLTDQSFYPSGGDLHCTLPILYMVMGAGLAAMLLFAGIGVFFSTPEPWFLPAALEALRFTLFAALGGVVTLGLLLLMMELVAAMNAGDPEAAAGRVRWREMADGLKRPAAASRDASRLWRRLFPWRVWILLGLMALSLLGLSRWL